jgi:trehalose 6-phosphate synthase
MMKQDTGELHQPILVVSNRGPFEHDFAPDGSLRARPGQGGVATALRLAADYRPTTWLSSPLTPADRLLAAAQPAGDEACRRFVPTDDRAYRLFYDCFSNEVLWFLQHEMAWQAGQTPATRRKAWAHGYNPVNKAFADAVVRETDATGTSAVMLHDYHFYTAPRLIRSARPALYLQQFVHIPWPAPAAWKRLEAEIVAAICDGLLANDSVFFQTPTAVENFLATCAAYLPQAQIDPASDSVRYAGHKTRVAANPISVDVEELNELRADPKFDEYRAQFEPANGERLIVRVDRLDPSKNVYVGFEAYEQLLAGHPDLRGRVRFLAFLVPTRSDVQAYDEYQKKTLALTEEINARFGNADWQPIEVRFENNRLQALAGLSLADVTLINPVADGMNLVAKEGVIVNDRYGALVLSTQAGAYRELAQAAIGIEPADVPATAEALYRALTLPSQERQERARRLRSRVVAHDLRMWFAVLLEDLERRDATDSDAELVPVSVLGKAAAAASLVNVPAA